MRRLATLVFLLLLIVCAHCEQWYSDQYRCGLRLPEGESWVRANPVVLKTGEMIFHATLPETKQSAAVIIIPRIPSPQLENPAVISRVMECIVALGYAVTNHQPVEIEGTQFMEFTAARKETETVNLFCVARATIRENTVYLALTTGPGSDERIQDKHFLRVLDTFTLGDPAAALRRSISSDPLFWHYRTTYIASAIAAAVLVLAAALVYAFARPVHR